MASDDYMSSVEAAERLGYTRQHVGRLIRQHRLEGRKLGRDWLVHRESVEQYMLERENLRLPLSDSKNGNNG